jgi:hypothetical protein
VSERSRKIGPHRVASLNQPYFLFATPSLDLLLAGNRAANFAELLDMNQTKNPLSRCESGYEPFSMFHHSALEVARHPDVQVS